MNAGDGFFIKNKNIDEHPWVIISDPEIDAQRVVIVNLTTYRPEQEKFCLIQPGEHPFVKHETCIAYKFARVVSRAKLIELRDGGRIEIQAPVVPALLDRIRQGVALSGRMPLDCVAIMARQRLT